ncbi:SIMPL domain-containing protein [Paracoccus tegillarcae]|uniref:SIMPL domain-containing protein n=1 Tax=Paracoccus tegillarcae TaxID=1529068 RepID=A0A2K9EVB2_9RHOB|nr:SIMPL domain-containing protein [Paracoccus tegillarcae]AUH34836.1 hypothetical protein CUV01_16925 [Paracoccus tegillarcae]
MTKPDFSLPAGQSRNPGPRAVLATILAGTMLLGGQAAMAAPGKGGDHACHGKMMRGHAARISVTGEGEALTQPDIATINLGVTTQADTAAAAMEQNSAQQTAVFEALAEAGIEGRDIQTSGLNLTPVTDYSREGQPPQVSGYRAQNMVTVRVRDLDSLGATLDTLVTAGTNEINGITFGRDDSDQVQDDARRDAVADARHRAEIMAEAAGLTLGPVLTMRDVVYGTTPPEPRMMRQAMDAAGAQSVPVAGGEMAMQASIEMQFALVGAQGGGDCGPDRMKGAHDGADSGSGADTDAGAATDTGADTDAAPNDENGAAEGAAAEDAGTDPVVPGAPEAGTVTDAEAEEIMDEAPTEGAPVQPSN